MCATHALHSLRPSLGDAFAWHFEPAAGKPSSASNANGKGQSMEGGDVGADRRRTNKSMGSASSNDFAVTANSGIEDYMTVPETLSQ